MHRKAKTASISLFLLLALLTVSLTLPATAAVLLLDDSLQGSTGGTRQGGQFANGGWQITGQYDSIHWHLPYPVHRGTAEFYLKGINHNECRSWMADKTEFYHMYDWTYGNADYDYGGYRGNPYKHFIRNIGCIGGTTNALELVWKIDYAYDEPDTPALSWNAGTNYRFSESWYPDNDGNTIINVYRDGNLLKSISVPGTFNPQGPSIRIGSSSRRMADYGAPLDAVYSYVKVWDDSSAPPSTPEVIAPRSGGSTNETSPRIMWAYTPASKYQVRLNTSNSPTSGIVWDSGEVVSNKNHCIAGPVSNGQNYYVFVRLWNGAGWSGWSANGHQITVNTAYTPPNDGPVWISGRSLYDNNGHFLGQGFTYMRALRDCKYDRDRFRANCAYMASRGFNYVRILSMVSWYTKEIMPIGGYNWNQEWIDGWPDYWQQFRDCIDIAHEYGLRTEVTIFADAQNCMPNESHRYAHMDGILSNVAGREHKVVFIEVANEFYQNGLTVSQLRDYGAYLNARTGRLIALSSSGGGASLQQIYDGSAADIATEHFSRDIFTYEGGWLPVRDPWYVDTLAGVPPCSSNEPVGPGSSVSTENDPIKLVSAACFAWIARLHGYVFHSTAGVAGDKRFEDMPGANEFKHVRNILPGTLASWIRNDGKEATAPFTAFCNGVANAYWTDIGGATSGCHRNIGSWKDDEFVCYPQGILSGGLTLQARQTLNFTVYNPMTGAVVMGPVTKNSGEQIYLPQGPGAYIIKGTGTITPNCASDTFTYPNGALNGNGGWYGSATSSQIQVADNYVVIYGGAGSYDAIKTMYCEDSGSGCISVEIKVYAGSGGSTIWSFWMDDTSGNNLGRWYGTANSARGRIGSTSDVTSDQTLVTGQWNTLLAKIYPASNATEFIFNGTPIGTLSHASQGAGDIVGRVRLERMDNPDAAGHVLYFDNLSTSSAAPDTTPPGPVTNFIATSGDTQNSLSWTNPGDADFQGTMIRFKTTGFPTGPTDGTQIYNSNGTSTTHTGLTNGVTYYYSAFAHDAVPNYAAGANASAVPADTTPPGPVTNFTATSGDMQNSLSWTKPVDSDLAGVMIRFSTSGYPGSPTGGTQCYNGNGTSFNHTELTNGVTYYYSAFAYDEVPNYSSVATTNAVPADVTPPGPVANFTATAGDTQNSLSWTNPGASDFAGTMIRFKTNGYPTGPTDGTLCYNGTGTGTTHTGLTNGVTYYYAAYAYDEVPNYSTVATTSATPVSAFCFQDEFNYLDGALVGVGGWTGNATSSHIQVISQMVKINGGSGARNATKTLNCTASGSGLIWVRLLAYRGTGDATMWDVWINDTAGKNLARWYGTGTTARGRIGGSALVTSVQNLQGNGNWDSLVVKIDVVANTTQFFYNGGDLGTFSHSSTGAGDVVGQVVIERSNNNGATGHHMFLDNIRVSQN